MNAAAEQAARPYNAQFPYLKFIDQYGNLDSSNYNGLQAVLTARGYHGLTLTTGYTFSHALGEAGDQASVNGLFLPINSYGSIRSQLYGPTSFDMRHRLTISESYILPGRKGFAQMLQGWSIDSTAAIQSGTPWGVLDNTTDFAGTGEQTGNPAPTEGSQWSFLNAQGGQGNVHDFEAIHNFNNVTPGPTGAPGVPFFPGTTNLANAPTANAACNSAAATQGPLALASLRVLGCYALGGSVLTPAPYGGYGTMPHNPFRDQGYRSFDLSVTKAFKFSERFSAQFRAEFFNAFNHPNFANPFGLVSPNPNLNPSRGGAPGLGFVSATPDQAASNPVLGAGGARDIQLGMKLIF